MNEFDYLNTFFNIVYQNESAYMRDILSSYEYVHHFCKWLNERNVILESLESITEQNHRLLKPRMKAKDVDYILHIPFSLEMQKISAYMIDKIHIIYIPGINQESFETHIKKYKNIFFYMTNIPLKKSDLSFFDPFPALFCAFNHADSWPGLLIFQNQKQVFCPIKEESDFQEVIRHIDDGDDLFEVYDHYDQDAYFIQLSDLHLGQNKSQKGMVQLLNSLDFVIPYLKSKQQLEIIITGDLMESPNRKNMYMANDFMNNIKKCYKADVTFILGNHDVIVHGFNFARNQKSKVIAYLLGENIKVLENKKIILIKMDTNSEGNLARGKIGQRQLDEIDDELEAIDHLEEYTLIVLLHHHVYPITKAQFIKTKWHEKTFINKIVESSKVLVDAPMLLTWLKKRKIRYVFHGHKHLPFFRYEDGCYFIGAGSATGGLKESQSRYISYNVVKYNVQDQKMKTCLIIYDDKARAERQRVEVYLFGEENE